MTAACGPCGTAFRVSWAHRLRRGFQSQLGAQPAAGLSESVGCTQRKHGICRVKIFEGVKRGLFIKSPLLRAPAAGNRVSMFAAGMFVWHFLFASFSFVPPCPKEKEELWNLIIEWKKVLFVRAGGYELPLCGNRRHLRSLARTFAVYHPTDSESPRRRRQAAGTFLFSA